MRVRSVALTAIVGLQRYARNLCSMSRPAITFVTGNQNKLNEVRAILGSDLPFELLAAKVDLPELQEDPEELTKKKCELAAQQVGGPVIVEDTSLCFNSLGGLPGVYVKWFLEKAGLDSLPRMLSSYEDKSAYAQCIFGFSAGPGCEPIVFVGRTHGKIVESRGPTNFGWDSVFEPQEGNGMTYAEMEKSRKNEISHRYKSLAQLREYLVANPELLSVKQ